MKNTLPSTITTAAVIVLLLFIEACKNDSSTVNMRDSAAIKKSLSSPQLTASESMDKMQLEEGFEVHLVAAEPLVIAPVAMTFDDKGRIWAVEMQNYMPDTSGTGEEIPSGKVVILTDVNADGQMDKRDIFLDSLVLPRAIAFIEKGILVAEPPYLWYYDIINDKPANKTLVDSVYAQGGNVEHQPNGLFRAMDNWIYSAKSGSRYRKQGDKWIKERTHFRGQWGISQDDDGRLFYNTNSENLLGDYFLPGVGAYNPHQRNVAGFSEKIVSNNAVYPAGPTPGVNRGYLEDVLDDSLKLENFTAACGPVIYNAHLFGKEYYQNAFVAEPAGNLIKRNILYADGNRVNGEQAYANKEFLASTDERFRPVNLYVGPDGALYVVDMYRGIIQHKTYLTPYLKNEIKERNLTKPLNAGRIYKIIPTNSQPKAPTISTDGNVLLSLLSHENGWVRNKAQQMIVDQKLGDLAPALRSKLSSNTDALTTMHSLWTLEGLGELQTEDVLPFLEGSDERLKRQALAALPSVMNSQNLSKLYPVLNKLANSDTSAAPYIGYLVHYIQPINKQKAQELVMTLANRYADQKYVADAIISNLENKEESFYKQVLAINPDTALAINKRLKKVLDDMEKEKKNVNSKEVAKAFPKGVAIYTSVCQTCHGPDGSGVTSLAPPLAGSNWVTGDKAQLIPIVLFGLTGPIKVGDKVYKAPEINGDMPAIGQNKEFTDEDIAQLLGFIRHSWGNNASKISAADVKATRNKFKDRQKPFTMDELKKIR